MVEPGPSAPDKQFRFEVPTSRVDLLWWHPDEPKERMYDEGYARFFCYHCDTAWDQSSAQARRKQPKCWCCGRFVRKPRSWSY